MVQNYLLINKTCNVRCFVGVYSRLLVARFTHNLQSFTGLRFEFYQSSDSSQKYQDAILFCIITIMIILIIKLFSIEIFRKRAEKMSNK